LNAINSLSIGLFLTLMALAPHVSALSSDKDQPVEIQADFAEMDDISGTTDYIGNVIVTQSGSRGGGWATGLLPADARR
jgi:lipopolysaccharide export system protein LptA